MNDEENRAEDAEALVAAGVRVHSMSPRSLAVVGPEVVALGQAVGAGVPAPFAGEEWERWLGAQHAIAPENRRAAVLVWRRPWMTMNGDTYGSSLLELIGVTNVFAGERERYPEVTLEEIAARRPDLVLLPSEPYAFKDRHIAEVEGTLRDVESRLVDGRDLFWWGTRTPGACERLRRRFVAT